MRLFEEMLSALGLAEDVAFGGAKVVLYAGRCAYFENVKGILSLGGEGAVFLGADFDGIDSTPRGLAGAQDMHRLYEELLRLNYPEALVGRIFYGNLMDILERTQ